MNMSCFTQGMAAGACFDRMRSFCWRIVGFFVRPCPLVSRFLVAYFDEYESGFCVLLYENVLLCTPKARFVVAERRCRALFHML